MKTKPSLNDIKNINITGAVTGDALTYDGTGWTNSPSAPPDRIIDGTTAMVVDTLGTAELVVDNHQVLSASASQTTFNRPPGDVAWIQNNNEDMFITTSPTSVMSICLQEGDVPGVVPSKNAITVWDTRTGFIITHRELIEAGGWGELVYTSVMEVTHNPFDGQYYIVYVPDLATSHLSVTPLLTPNLATGSTTLAVTNNANPLSFYPRTRDTTSTCWVNANQLTIAVSSQGDIHTDPGTSWEEEAALQVMSIRLDTDTVIWSKRIPMIPSVRSHMDATGIIMVGKDPLTPRYHVVRMSPAGTILSTVDVEPTDPNATFDTLALHSVGDISYIAGEFYDNTIDYASMYAVNHVTGNLLWHQMYYLPDGTRTVSYAFAEGIIPHPTDPTLLVMTLTCYYTDNHVKSAVVSINAATGLPVIGGGLLATAINDLDEVVQVELSTLGSSDGMMCMSGQFTPDGVTTEYRVISLSSLVPVVIGDVHLSSISTTVVTPPSTLTTTLVTLPPLPSTVGFVSNANIMTSETATPLPAPSPAAFVGTDYVLGVEGAISVGSDIILNGTTGAEGEVIMKASGRPTWGVAGGTVPNPTWIINSSNHNIANTHVNWIGTDAPLDPYANVIASFVNNIALGVGTLNSHPIGGEDTFTDNIAIGSYALSAIGATDNRNIAIGTNAGKLIHTGTDSICIGVNAGQAGGTSDRSIAIGTDAAGSLSSGTQASYESVAIGYHASADNGTLQGSVGVGAFAIGAGRAENAVAVGHRALVIGDDSSVTIPGTVAIGKDSQSAIPVGDANTAVGAYTLSVAMGASATPYKYNTAVGHSAMKTFYRSPYDNVYNNTAVGYNAMQIASGEANTAIGVSALQGSTSQFSDGYAGDYNTALGYNALFDQSGYDNVSRFSNCTGVGARTMVDGNNQVQLGDSSTTTYSYGVVQNRSDARDKADIRDTVIGLNFIQQLRPVDFKWDYREDYVTSVTAEDGSVTWTRIPPDGTKKRTRYHHGLIAQEVKQVSETTGLDFGGYQDHTVAGGNDVLSLGYEELIAPLIKAIQELATQNQALADRVAALESSIGG